MGLNKITSADTLNQDATILNPKEEPLVYCAVETAIGQKGMDVRILDVRSVTDIADFFVIVSGTSERHVKGIADRIVDAAKRIDERPLSLSGCDRGEWIVLDYTSVIVHVFFEPIRQYYDLDGLWRRGGVLALPEELEVHARRLRTERFL